MFLGINDDKSILRRLARFLDSRAIGPIRKITVESDFARLPSIRCDSVKIYNQITDPITVIIRVKRGATSESLQVRTWDSIRLDVSSNADEIYVANEAGGGLVDIKYEVFGEILTA